MTQDLPSRTTPQADAGAEPGAPPGWPLHLLALGSFAVAQPLFEVLGGGATFFVARRSPPADLWLFALATALLPGLAAIALVALGLRAGRLAGRALLGLCVGLLAALLALAPLSRAAGGEALWPLGAAALCGGAAAWLHARQAFLRSFLTILAPAPLVFALIFLFAPGVRRLALPARAEAVLGLGASGAPSAIFLVFDELPLQSLLAADGSIDVAHFPGFARLAAGSTWFPNATASHESTEVALPMILTGLRSGGDLLPTAADHPRSVFSMLAGSHRMRTWETFTSVCPESIDDRGAAAGARASVPAAPARLASLARDSAVIYGHIVLPGPLARRWLPAIDNTWGSFGQLGGPAPDGADPAASDGELDGRADSAEGRTRRPELVREFIEALDDDAQPTLYFLHVLLPHGPFVHLPSGSTYDPFGLPSDFQGGRLPEDEGIATQQLQRHLLQLGALDALLVRLLDRTDELGLTERCAWVVLADHGINFEPGEHVRQVFRPNSGEIAWVPFFVRRPGQREAAIDTRAVETLDALPTLLDALGLESPWPLDGRSALGADAPRAALRAVARRFHEPLELGDAPATSRRGLARKLALLGGAADWSGLWAAGLAPQLRGRRASELAAGVAAGLTLRLDGRAAPGPGRAAIVVAGFVEPAPGRALPDALLVSVDGVLRCGALTLERRGGRLRFSALVDEAVWSAGAGRVEVWVPRGDGRLERVAER